MQRDTERLFVQLEARINGFEKQMAKAEKRGTRTYQGLERGSKRATAAMEKDMQRSTGRINQALATTSNKIGGFAKGFLPVLGAGALAGTVTAIGQVARGIADIGREARRAGIDVKSFQELGFVADQNRIPIDALTDGLKELNIRADEFIKTGGGGGAEAFQRLGFGADELQRKLKNPRDLFIEIIGKLQQLDKAAQIRISDELFGGSAGERFVELLDEGADKIREQIQEARNLGLVLDKDVIARAEEIDQKFAIVSRTVGTALKGAIVDAAFALGQFIDKFRSFENQQESTLDSRISQIGLERIDIENKILSLKNEQRSVTGALAEAERRNIQGTINALKEQSDALAKEEAKILNILSSRESVPSAVAPFTEVTLPEKPKTNTSIPSKRRSNIVDSGSRDRSIENALRERAAVAELISELEEELSLIGATDVAKRAAEGSRLAGADATDQERARVIELNEALYQGIEAERQRTIAMEERYDAIHNGLSGIYADLQRGESFTDAFANAFERMADRVIDTFINDISAALSGQGGTFGNIFGMLFGGSGFGGVPSSSTQAAAVSGFGLFQSGGYTGDGAINAPAGIVHGKEYVVNAAATKRHRGMLEAINSGRSIQSSSNQSAPSSGSGGGRTVVELNLSADVEARILSQSENQSVQITKGALKDYTKNILPKEAMRSVQKSIRAGKSIGGA